LTVPRSMFAIVSTGYLCRCIACDARGGSQDCNRQLDDIALAIDTLFNQAPRHVIRVIRDDEQRIEGQAFDGFRLETHRMPDLSAVQ